MEILKYGDPLLRRKSKIVKPGDPDIAAGLLERMFEDMHSSDGIGLAAPQIGILKKIVVIHIPGDPEYILKLINPKITWASEEMASCEEGCLSVPGVYEAVERPASVTVEYSDENFEPCIIEKAEGLLAVCLQHEIDHLEGKLFIDHLDRSTKCKITRAFRKKQKEEALMKAAEMDAELMGEGPEMHHQKPKKENLKEEMLEAAEEIEDAIA